MYKVHIPKVNRLKHTSLNPALRITPCMISPLRKGADALGQIGVGAVVFRNELAEQRDDGFGVDGKELFHREAVRRGELQNDEMSAGYEYAAHFGQSFIQSVKVTDAERHGHGIEAFDWPNEREVQSSRANEILSERCARFTFHVPRSSCLRICRSR